MKWVFTCKLEAEQKVPNRWTRRFLKSGISFPFSRFRLALLTYHATARSTGLTNSGNFCRIAVLLISFVVFSSICCALINFVCVLVNSCALVNCCILINYCVLVKLLCSYQIYYALVDLMCICRIIASIWKFTKRKA